MDELCGGSSGKISDLLDVTSLRIIPKVKRYVCVGGLFVGEV